MAENSSELDEKLISAWVTLTGTLKNTRITKGLVYNEAIVMLFVYRRWREEGAEYVSFKDLVAETGMLKSLVNRTIDALIQPEHIAPYLAVHERSLELAHSLREIIGDEDAEAFVRISRKISERIREEAAQGRTGKP